MIRVNWLSLVSMLWLSIQIAHAAIAMAIRTAATDTLLTMSKMLGTTPRWACITALMSPVAVLLAGYEDFSRWFQMNVGSPGND